MKGSRLVRMVVHLVRIHIVECSSRVRTIPLSQSGVLSTSKVEKQGSRSRYSSAGKCRPYECMLTSSLVTQDHMVLSTLVYHRGGYEEQLIEETDPSRGW